MYQALLSAIPSLMKGVTGLLGSAGGAASSATGAAGAAGAAGSSGGGLPGLLGGGGTELAGPMPDGTSKNMGAQGGMDPYKMGQMASQVGGDASSKMMAQPVQDYSRAPNMSQYATPQSMQGLLGSQMAAVPQGGYRGAAPSQNDEYLRSLLRG